MSLIEFHGSLDVVAFDKSRGLTSQNGAALQTSMRSTSSDWRTPRPSRGEARRFATTMALAAGRRPRLTASDRRNWRLTPSADDCAVSLAYQFIDQWRWGLSLNEVRLHRCDRNFRQHERGAPKTRRGRRGRTPVARSCSGTLRTAEPGYARHAGRRRPVALYEILAAVKQEQARVIQMQARPGGGVKSGCEPVAGFDGRDESLLIGEGRFQPQFTEQRVARSEALVERTLGSSQPSRDRIDRHGRGTAFASDRAGRSEEAGFVEKRSAHSL